MEGQRFIVAGGFDEDSLGLEVQLNLMTPMLDRYSPIAYSIANYIHHEVAKHAGFETCYRLSLNYCHILQGASLMREIVQYAKKAVPGCCDGSCLKPSAHTQSSILCSIFL